jgi:hypothetical protein
MDCCGACLRQSRATHVPGRHCSHFVRIPAPGASCAGPPGVSYWLGACRVTPSLGACHFAIESNHLMADHSQQWLAQGDV